MSRPALVGRGPGTYLFDGSPKVFFLAFCATCWPDRWAPMPFGTQVERDTWASGHLSGPLSGDHAVELYVEVRCAPEGSPSTSASRPA